VVRDHVPPYAVIFWPWCAGPTMPTTWRRRFFAGRGRLAGVTESRAMRGVISCGLRPLVCDRFRSKKPEETLDDEGWSSKEPWSDVGIRNKSGGVEAGQRLRPRWVN